MLYAVNAGQLPAGSSVDLIYSYQSGMGIEVVRMAPLLRRLVGLGIRVSIYSFHAFIYDNCFSRNLLLEGDSTEPELESDFGFCFYCEKRNSGPYRNEKIMTFAKASGYFMIPEDLGFADQNAYAASELLGETLLPAVTPCKTSILYRSPIHGRLILNLFGGASLEKGFFLPEVVKRLIGQISRSLPKWKFVVPVLPNRRHIVQKPSLSGARNIEVINYKYYDPELTKIVSGSPAIITVEGGMLHLAVEYGKPVIALLGVEWVEKVLDVLPPAFCYSPLILDLRQPDVDAIVNAIEKITTSLSENYD